MLAPAKPPASLAEQPRTRSSPEGAKEGAWPLVPLSELVVINPRPGNHELADDSLASFIPMRCVEEESGRFEPLGDRKVAGVRKGYTPFRDGDVIFAKVTPCMENGKAAVLKGLTNGIGFGSTEFFVLRPTERLDANYLLHFILQSSFRRQAARSMTGAVGLRRVPKSFLEQQPIPLRPLPEQRRIVAEIEKQFTRLEAGVAALRRVQANLGRYRAAVLKAACEGKLVPTEAELSHSQPSTKGSQPTYETGGALLRRIFAERRTKWQGRGKHKEPAAPDVTNLATLAEGWAWASWEMVLAHEEGAFRRGPFGSALTKSIFVEKGFKVYEQYCPINDDCSFVRYYITPEKFGELQTFEVKAGDYLISCSGVTLGRITRVPEQFERGIINQALLRVRINESVINHRYFLHLFRSAIFQKAIFDNSSGSAIPNVKGVKELKAMAIPLPPLAEQARIVAEVERRLSVVQELEAVVSANLQRAARLRQSILQKAFAGNV
jgi:type I restriction enzyme S subunit